MLAVANTPRDLRCTKVPTISLILPLQPLMLLGISAGHERCLVPSSNLGHTSYGLKGLLGAILTSEESSVG